MDRITTHGTGGVSVQAGRARRYHDLAKVEALGDEARKLISIFVSQPVTLPLTFDFLERHPQGGQACMPLHEERFLIVVAPPGESNDLNSVRACRYRHKRHKTSCAAISRLLVGVSH